LDDEPRSATVTTCGAVLCIVVGRDEFRAFLGQHAHAARVVAGMVGEKLRGANRRRLDLAGYTVPVRVARILSEFSEAYGGKTPDGHLVLQLTQDELAGLIGAATATVQASLRALREQGLIQTRYREIAVLRPDALWAFAHSA